MKRLGVVENIVFDGSVIVRSAFAPNRGAHVFDARHRPLGTVYKVFGPVREPFATVHPRGKVPLSILGSDVYVGEGEHANEEGRRGRRSH